MKTLLVGLVGAAIGATALFVGLWAWLTKEWWRP